MVTSAINLGCLRSAWATRLSPYPLGATGESVRELGSNRRCRRDSGCHRRYFQHRAKVMDDDVWEGYRISLITNLTSRGGRKFWSMRAAIFHGRFREYVERYVLASQAEAAPIARDAAVEAGR